MAGAEHGRSFAPASSPPGEAAGKHTRLDLSSMAGAPVRAVMGLLNAPMALVQRRTLPRRRRRIGGHLPDETPGVLGVSRRRGPRRVRAFVDRDFEPVAELPSR